MESQALTQAAKDIAPYATPFINEILTKWISPKISQWRKDKKLSNDAGGRPIKHFQDYLLRTYARLSYMSTIVFGNQQKRIEDLYIPLTLVAHGKDVSCIIDKWDKGLIPSFKRLVITDTAGMGKSTVMKWLFRLSMSGIHGIPIFLELRSLSRNKGIIDSICSDLCPIDETFDRDLLLSLIRDGNFIFFFDGFDEIPFEEREVVTQEIQRFISKALNNYFVIASRHETALSCFGDFQEFTIRPLTKNEAFSLLKKYDPSGEHADALIKELKGAKFYQLRDLLVNPMLVSLLFKAYSYKPLVPFKKHIFYRQVFDALFDMHDATKGSAFIRNKHSGLDVDEFHLVLRDLGFMTAKTGRVEYEKDYVTDLLRTVRERNSTLVFQPSQFLKDLVTTVPLFNKEGETYKWAHKSVQEYFASQFIAVDAKEYQIAVLQKIYEGQHCKRLENVLDLLHDADPRAFRIGVLKPWLKDFVAYIDSRYQGEYTGVSREEILKRRSICFGFEGAILFCKKEEANALFAKTFTNIVAIFQKKLKLSNKRRPVIIGLSGVGELAVLLAVSPGCQYGMHALLRNKGYTFILGEDSGGEVDDFVWDNRVKAGEVYLINDSKKNLLNEPGLFGRVTRWLSDFGALVDEAGARRALELIEDEPGERTRANQLFGNL